MGDRTNHDQIEYWNEKAGSKWVELQPRIDAQIAPFGELAMERAAFARGERVLDVGCGCGTTTFEIARRVAPDGQVTGIDVSRPMLEVARKGIDPTTEGRVRFLEADAQSASLPAGAFDVVFSRFGVMFFADPPAAFRNLRSSLGPGGRLAFVAWRPMEENPWVLVPLRTVLRHVPPPEPPAPDEPGPFALADADRVRRILQQAGFRDVTLEAADRTLAIGGDGGVDDAVDFLLQIGPAARLLEGAGPDVRTAVTADLRSALHPLEKDGAVRATGAVWIVTASNEA